MSADAQSGGADDCGDPHELLFGVRRSVRYHNHRRRFFDTWSKASSFLKVLSGTGTFTAVAAKAPGGWVQAWALAVATFSAADLIFQPSQHARVHHDLAKRFNMLEREITVAASRNIPRSELSALCAKRLEIEADEPPVLRNLDSVCHNELCKAMGCDKGHFVRLGFLQRHLAPLFDLFESSVEKINAGTDSRSSS